MHIHSGDGAQATITAYSKKRSFLVWLTKTKVLQEFVAQQRKEKRKRKSRKKDGPAEWGALGLTQLSYPTEVHANIIFVHGLRGGSYRTWRNGDDNSSFWPQEWLPSETGFQNTRIFTFGYDCDWTGSDSSILDIHDFGEHLFSELMTSPYWGKNDSTPIILAGHSMGGLVSKKAYTLSREDPGAAALADRIRGIVFLATPHKGSDHARLLNNVLRTSGMFKPLSYVEDLQRNSPSLQVISEEFKQYSGNLRLWSFYETRRMRLGLMRRYIVDKDSAISGLENEGVRLLRADHRQVARFNSPLDANYKQVRDTLAFMVADISDEWIAQKKSAFNADICKLQPYLATSDYHVEDLQDLENEICPGTCNWLSKRHNFQDWLNDDSNPRRLYSLASGPGAGKSVLAAYVVRYLQSQGHNCAFYFFKDGDKRQKRAASFLLSLAYQLAFLNQEIRQFLLSLQRDGVEVDQTNPRAIWRTLFMQKLLDVPISTPQYIIVDGLDECADPSTLMALLSNIKNKFPIRILITSRPSLEFKRYFNSWGTDLTYTSTSDEDTLQDIRTSIKREIESLQMPTSGKRQVLADKIVEKSEGSFLWVRQVLQEIEPALSEERIDTILDSVPARMASLYSRSLKKFSNDESNAEVLRGILVWVLCSFQPLKALQLQAALVFDTGKSIRALDSSMESRCAHLIRFSKSNAIEIVHATAREFLLSSQNTEFAIDPSSAHLRLGIVCLRYLITDEMRPPRHRAETMEPRGNVKSTFADYASTSFSDHLALVSSADEELIGLLCQFLKANVISWIEYILECHGLDDLVRTGKNLWKYLDQGGCLKSRGEDSHHLVMGWAVDLPRLVSNFGRRILDRPRAVQYLIPPFCPPQSAIYQQFGQVDDVIKVEGGQSPHWDDCVASIGYHNALAKSLASGDNIFALGMNSGDILLYDQLTCETISTFKHGEPVKLLKFGPPGHNVIASAGAKHLRLWDIEGPQIWVYNLESPCVFLSFSQDCSRLILLMRPHQGVQLSLEDGTEIKEEELTGFSNILSITFNQAPRTALMSADASIIAVLYRGRPVHLWSLVGQRNLIGFCGRNAKSPSPGLSPLAALFSPDSKVNTLAISYEHGELALYNPWTQQELISVDCVAFSLAATPDGKILASADAHGGILLWDFETLTLLHKVTSYEAVYELAFSSDGCRLIDVRYTVSHIWEPVVLTHRDSCELLPAPAPTSTSSSEVESHNPIEDEIVAMAFHPAGNTVFAATSSSVIYSFNASTGWKRDRLHSMHDCPISQLFWSKTEDMLFSADIGGRIVGRQLEWSDGHWEISFGRHVMKFDLKFSCGVREIVYDPEDCVVLVSGDEHAAVFRSTHQRILKPERPRCIAKLEFSSVKPRKWMEHPKNSAIFVQLVDSEFHLYSCETLTQIRRFSLGDIGEDLKDNIKFQARLMNFRLANKTYILTGHTPAQPELSSSPFYIWDSKSLRPDSPSGVKPIATVSEMKYVLGFRTISSTRFPPSLALVFLDQDLWVCSYDLTAILHPNPECARERVTERRRHFFIPYDFGTRESGIKASLTDQGDIAFARGDKLTVVRCDWEKLVDWV